MNLLLFVCLISCSIYSISGFRLQTLCKNESFQYDNRILKFNHYIINATIEYSFIYEVPKFNSLILSNKLNFTNWSKNQNEINDLNQKRNEFNKIIINFHTEDNINNSTGDQLKNLSESIASIEKFFDNYKTKINLDERSTYYTVKATTNRTLELIKNLISLKVNEKINLNILPEDKLIQLLKAAYERKKLRYPLSFTFYKHHEKYYLTPIARFNRYITNDPESESFIDYTYYVPVQKNVPLNPNEPCLTSINLPRFYKEKKRN